MTQPLPSRAIWEQLEGESVEAYVRFLAYRNFGPTRTLQKAADSVQPPPTKVKKTKPVSIGQWEQDSAQFNWRERAAKWDISQLSQVVPETTAVIFQAIQEYARQTLQQLLAGDYKPRNWAELRESVIVLASFISPEVVSAAANNAIRVRDDDAGDHRPA